MPPRFSLLTPDGSGRRSLTGALTAPTVFRPATLHALWLNSRSERQSFGHINGIAFARTNTARTTDS
jgi:hypothetical protein